MNIGNELNIQISSASLGNPEGGPLRAVTTLAEGLSGKNSHTQKVLEEARQLKAITIEHRSNATFGISILPTMIRSNLIPPESSLVSNGSIDIPYLIRWREIWLEKLKDVMSREGLSMSAGMSYLKEMAYTLMQAGSEEKLQSSLDDSLGLFENNNPIVLRTCIENASDSRVQGILKSLVKDYPNVIFALEPNSKLVRDLSSYRAVKKRYRS